MKRSRTPAARRKESPILKIRIQALTKQAETDPARFDWNLASPFQIGNLLESVYGKQMSPDQRQQLAKEIIDLRSKQQFLLPNEEIKKNVDTFKAQKKLKHRHDKAAA